MQVALINANGLKQIADALGEHHKLGRDHFTAPMLNSWARDAEEHFSDGLGCYFEIRAVDAAHGSPVQVEISRDGYEVKDVTDE